MHLLKIQICFGVLMKAEWSDCLILMLITWLVLLLKLGKISEDFICLILFVIYVNIFLSGCSFWPTSLCCYSGIQLKNASFFQMYLNFYSFPFSLCYRLVVVTWHTNKPASPFLTISPDPPSATLMLCGLLLWRRKRRVG